MWSRIALCAIALSAAPLAGQAANGNTQAKGSPVMQVARGTFDVKVKPAAADPADRKAVLNELWRLGGLAGEELEAEKLRLLDNRPLLFAMATHAHIRTTAKSSPKTLVTKLIQFARRVEENTS